MMQPRLCYVVTASVEDKDGRGDGAYDLLDVSGAPSDIGRAIAESLRTTDLMGGSPFSATIDDRGEDLYLTVRIKFGRIDTCRPPESDEEETHG